MTRGYPHFRNPPYYSILLNWENHETMNGFDRWYMVHTWVTYVYYMFLWFICLYGHKTRLPLVIINLKLSFHCKPSISSVPLWLWKPPSWDTHGIWVYPQYPGDMEVPAGNNSLAFSIAMSDFGELGYFFVVVTNGLMRYGQQTIY